MATDADKAANSRKSPSDATSRYFLMSGLLHAYYWMDESLQNHIKAAGLPEGSRTQSLVWANIADGVRKPSDLARRIGISRQAIQQLLAEMQRQGLIELVPDPEDGRAKIVQYSERGRKMGHVLMRAIEHINRELEQRLGSQAVEMLSQLLVDQDWGDPITASAADVAVKDSDKKGPALKAVVDRASKRRGFSGPRKG